CRLRRRGKPTVQQNTFAGSNPAGVTTPRLISRYRSVSVLRACSAGTEDGTNAMLFRMNGLVKRGGVWQYRRMVPPRLRSIIGSSEVKRSLGTRDLQAAQRRWQAVKAEVDRLFAEAEASLKNPSIAAYKAVEEWRQDRTARPV